MSGAWHDVDDGLRALYTSTEEYAKTLLKLWTLLTFYWGSGAVWPRCTHRQNPSATADDKNVCGEPLLTMTSKSSGNNAACRTRNCRNRVEWTCFRQGHDYMCRNCLTGHQDRLVGSPGPQASTDIYDAVIEREIVRRDETVYLLNSVESRKPPKIAPNWKTSYLFIYFFII